MNNNFMRAQQGNRNRNRNNRPRHRSTGGNSGSSGGGNSANKVFDSNGPDVKLRGTAQTIAEKYMQLGRDSQSSGDSVAAENYYQHAEHYYRIWAANQPVGHSLQMSRKLGEDEFEDDNGQEPGDDEGAEGQMPEAVNPAEPVEAQIDAPAQDSQPLQERLDRNARNPREGGRERFRPRWQNRRDRPASEANRDDAAAPQVEPATGPVPNGEGDAARWEAPSFLQRPTLAPAEPPAAEAEAEAEVAPRPARTRRPREAAPPSIVDDKPKED